MDISRQEEQRLFNRKLVLLAHVPAALVTAVVYLNRVDFSRFHYWRRNAVIVVLFVATPSLLPYVVSAVHSWRSATYNRLRVAMFLAILTAGAAVSCGAINGTWGSALSQSELLRLWAIQACAYFLAAEFLFDVD